MDFENNKNNNVNFNDFDSFDGLTPIVHKEAGNQHFVGYSDYAFNPWRRWFARGFDYYLSSMFASVILFSSYSLDFIATTPQRMLNLHVTLIGIIILLVIEPLLITFIKTTPGKAIFNLYVVTNDGENLSVVQSYKRAIEVFIKGQCLQIPFASVYMSYLNYKKCKNGNLVSWDKDVQCKISEVSNVSIAIYIIAYIISFLIFSEILDVIVRMRVYGY